VKIIRKRDQLPLNSDHTHFIIIREQPIGTNSVNSFGEKCVTNDINEIHLEKLSDSAESATNKFRGRFEEFLHQETSQQQPAAPSVTTIGINKFFSTQTIFDCFI
jgi:hypothetical protein